MRKGFLLFLSFATLAASAFAGAAPVSAATYTVNTTTMLADTNPGDGICQDANGNCGLIAAMQEANATTAADTIILPSGTYTLPATLVSVYEVTVTGSGASTTIIDRSELNNDPAFKIQAKTRVSGVTVYGFSQAMLIPTATGGVTVTLDQVKISHNGNRLQEQGPAITNASSQAG